MAALAIGGAAVAFSGGGDDESATDDTLTELTTPDTVSEPSTTPAAPTTVAPTTTAVPATTVGPADMNTIARSVVLLSGVDASGNQLCSGSGTIVSSDGLILTNAHVVENAGECAYDSLMVSLTERADAAPTPTYFADVVAFDPALDLAVVRVARDLDGAEVTPELAALPIGDSDAVGLGDRLRILGFPAIGGDTITFTEGSVSGFTAEAGIGERAWIKTDATIAGGNSGGTAVNDAGEIVAVPTQASAGDNDVADCRVVQDTNGDNVVDDADTCIPIGGFINGLRPVVLALDLIEQGRTGAPIDPIVDEPSQADLDSVAVFSPVFSAEVVDDQPGEIVLVLPSAAPQVCGFFDYEGMTDGITWDALWTVNGEVNSEYSFVADSWNGGDSGTWWVCAVAGEGGLVDGLYELSIYVEDSFQSSNTVHVGNELSLVEVDVLNATGLEVCYLRVSPSEAESWGADELGADQTLLADQRATVTVVAGTYDVLAQDCELTTVAEQYAIDLTASGEFILTT